MKRIVITVLVSSFALLVAARPASAQNKVDFSASYQFFRFLEDGAENIPAGWNVSIFGGKSEMLKIVGEAAGNYKDGGKLHTFQGGVELSPKSKNPNSLFYVRLLTGVGINSGGGDSENAWALTPQAGVRVFGKGQWGGQFGVGFPIFREDGNTHKSFTFTAGITCRSKK